jgi:hypothetical protein
MNQAAQETVNPQEEAQKIWNQLDAEEQGGAQALGAGRDPAAQQASDAELEQASSAAPAAQEPAAQAGSQQQDAPSPDASQALLDRIAGLESLLNQTTQRLRNAEGHIGGLNSQLKQQLQTAQQVSAQGGDAPSAKQIAEAQTSSKAMEALRRDYPEFADAMDAALEERMQQLAKRMPAAPAAAAAPSITPADLKRFEAEVRVEVRHPGWKETVQEPVFQGWLQRQAREVQMLAASESPQDAIRLLDLYGDSAKSTAAQRTQRLNAAAAIPSGRSGAAPRTKAVEDMSAEEYWRYLDELDRQKGNRQ